MIKIETKNGPQIITRNQVVGYLIAIWFTCVLASAGVSWIAAAKSADHSNATLKTIVALQRQQGHDGLDLIYQDAKARCRDGTAARDVIISNTEAQERYYAFLYTRRAQAPDLLGNLPVLKTPPKVRDCSKSVQDPNKPENHLVLKPPAEVTG